jgi:hypothetical protein
MRRRFLFSSVILVGLLSACGDGKNTSSGTSAGVQEVVTPVGLSSDVVAAMDTAIQGEYLNEQTYRRVTEDFGAVQPFFNIAFVGVRRSQRLADLYEKNGLDVPVSQWNSENVPRFASSQDACRAAVLLERQTMVRYNQFLTTLDLPGDVAKVFTTLRNIARDKRLPAFQSCS